ncbi:MurR/RpiR family transcriptional regulator [Microbacterium sp. EST19A]|uniref:MurR/RpiR family transcriptional regulator n=1 Tax=Microbacterium sp. EST19A TaxID=2862681 RepID=UPI001CC08D8D|nr:MurR/RpiR family transcriptional regulator [Microbacterium sp. EST19A]
MADDTNISPLEVLRAAIPKLTGAKLRVAEMILRDPLVAGENSITWLAAEAETSPATITRLAASLGFTGFPALRAAIALENGRGAQAGWERDIGSAILPDDPADKVLSTLAGNQFQAARNAMAAVDLSALERLADSIVAAGRVHLFGEWGDAPVAYELYLRLFRIGIPIWFHEGAYFAQVGAGRLGERDLALVMSRSGESVIAERFVDVARAHGATTAVITGDAKAAISRKVDIAVVTGTATVGVTSWTDYFAGRSSDTLICAALWALVAQRMPDFVFDRLEADDPAAPPGSSAKPRRKRR